MANIIRGGLNVAGADLVLSCIGAAGGGFGGSFGNASGGGLTRCGIALTGTWVGTASFYVSYDGANFFPKTVTPFPSGTGVQSATANGNWFADLQGAVAVQVALTAYTSGVVGVSIAAALDGSWQDAFLASTSKYVSQNVTGGLVNSQVIAAQANRAWRCRSASVSFNSEPSVAIEFQILDGASSVLWDGYVPKDIQTSAPGGVFQLPLPPPDPAVPGSGGVVGTVGNTMTLKLFAPGGSVVSTVNAEMAAA